MSAARGWEGGWGERGSCRAPAAAAAAAGTCVRPTFWDHGDLCHAILNTLDHIVMTLIKEGAGAGAHVAVFGLACLIVHHPRLGHLRLGLHSHVPEVNPASLVKPGACQLLLTILMMWSHSSSLRKFLNTKARGFHDRWTTSPRHSSCACTGVSPWVQEPMRASACSAPPVLRSLWCYPWQLDSTAN